VHLPPIIIPALVKPAYVEVEAHSSAPVAENMHATRLNAAAGLAAIFDRARTPLPSQPRCQKRGRISTPPGNYPTLEKTRCAPAEPAIKLERHWRYVVAPYGEQLNSILE